MSETSFWTLTENLTPQSGAFPIKYGRQWQSPKPEADKATSLINLAIKDTITHCWRFCSCRQDQALSAADPAWFLGLSPALLQFWFQISAAPQLSPRGIFAHPLSGVRNLLRKFTGAQGSSPSLWSNALLLHCFYSYFYNITADNQFFYRSTTKSWK